MRSAKNIRLRHIYVHYITFFTSPHRSRHATLPPTVKRQVQFLPKIVSSGKKERHQLIWSEYMKDHFLLLPRKIQVLLLIISTINIERLSPQAFPLQSCFNFFISFWVALMVRLHFLSYLILMYGFLHTLASWASIWLLQDRPFLSPCTFLWQMLPPLYKAQWLNSFPAAKTTLTGMSTDSSPVCRSCYLTGLKSCQSSHGGLDFPLIMLTLAKNTISWWL